MTSDLLIVTAPKPPGSRQLISPPAAVFEMAPAHVLHGAVRLHGLTSSPVPDTHVRVACARASDGPPTTIPSNAIAASTPRPFPIIPSSRRATSAARPSASGASMGREVACQRALGTGESGSRTTTSGVSRKPPDDDIPIRTRYVIGSTSQ